jgi:hypothetical protein
VKRENDATDTVTDSRTMAGSVPSAFFGVRFTVISAAEHHTSSLMVEP